MYNEYVMGILREVCPNMTDAQITSVYSKDEIFDMICNYEGFINCDRLIKKMVVSVYGGVFNE